MKKVYLTGITGTVAPYIKEAFLKEGYHVDDTHIRINHIKEVQTLKHHIKKSQPDMIIHAALGPIETTEMLAAYSKLKNIPFIYISTVSVFEDNNGGPYHKEDAIHVKNEYGLYKYTSEQHALNSNPHTYIIRLGWQISPNADTESNNMFKFIKDNTNDQGIITVSNQFYPSASFLDNMANAVVDIIKKPPGLYLVNSNPKYSLYEILHLLKDKFKLQLTIQKDDTFQRNDLMVDYEVKVQSL
jgi:dTDP-4-dehydrorhamnose reductase